MFLIYISKYKITVGRYSIMNIKLIIYNFISEFLCLLDYVKIIFVYLFDVYNIIFNIDNYMFI